MCEHLTQGVSPNGSLCMVDDSGMGLLEIYPAIAALFYYCKDY